MPDTNLSALEVDPAPGAGSGAPHAAGPSSAAVGSEAGPPAAAPTAQPVPPTAAAPEEADGAIDVQGQRYVPHAAVHQARKDLREAKDQLQRYEAAATELAPYIQYLQQHPELLTGTAPPETAQEPDAEAVAAEELARTLDLYTREGKPDVDRARKIDGLISQRAHAVAEQVVQPMRTESATERSVRNFQRALETPAPNGQKVNAETLRQIWAAMPVEYTADDRIAATLAYFTLGYDQVHGQTPARPPATPPLVTEPAGSRTGHRPTGLSDLEKRIAELRGVKNEEWAKLTERWQPGRPNILEE